MRPLLFSKPHRVFSALPAGLVLALALCAHRVEPGRAATHDLTRDFSIATNPNGVWSYGWLSDFGGPFTPMDTPRADEVPSIPIWSWSVGGFSPPDAHFNAGTNTFTGDGGTFPPGSLWVCPGPEGTPRNFGVMRFTVPVNGAANYRIIVEAEPYLGELSGDTDFHITRNGETLLSQLLTSRGRASYLDVLALAPGDTIDLMVGRGPDGALHGSCLKLQAELTRVDEPPPPPPPGTNCVPIVPGLAGWWPGDGDASDLIGGHHGVVGAAGFASGKIGPAFTFNGSNSSVRIPASPALDVGSGAGLTVECWINPADLAVRSPLVEWNRNGPGIITWGVHLYILRPDEFGLGAGNLVANLSEPSGVSHLILAPGGTVAASTWQHVALTYDKAAGQARLYRDGQLVGESSVGSFTPETSYDLYFGRRPSGDAVLSYRGLLDDVGIYHRALSANEILRIVQAGAAGKCSTNMPPPPPPVQAFDLSRDYSLASNPNGPWTYGYLTDLDGSFGPLAASRTFSADNGVPIAAWELNTYQLPGVWKVLGPGIAHSDGEHFTAEPGTIYFAPGADNAPQNFGAIRFTVPPGAGGPYRILTSVRSLFDAGRSRDADFHVLKNRQELFGQFLPPNSATSYSNVLTLAVGDHIDFAIGRGTDGLTADTGLKIQASLTPLILVTNPPTPAPFYDVAADYSTVNNPNGPWSYGWKETVSGEFSRITFAKHFFAENGVPIFTWLLSDTQQPSVSYVVGPGTAVSAAGQFVAEPGTLYFTAGDDNTRQNFGAVRFTVPPGQSGRFRLETSARDLFDGFFQGDTDFHIVRNGQELFGRSLPVHAVAGYTNVLELAEGDVIDFLIGRGEDGHQAGSGLKLLARLTPTTNAPPSPPGEVFDLSRDYSLASNPNGPWTYGYLTTLNGAFGPLAATRTFGADNGVPIAAWELDTYQIPGVWKVLGPGVAHSDGDHFTADPGTVYFAPGADGAPQNFGAIRFTVPASGQYRVETRVRSLFDGGRSRDADFHVLKNGQELYGEFLPPNTATTYSNVLGLVAGDRIDFAIGRGLDGLTADTGLKIQATLTLTTNAPPPPVEFYDVSRDFSPIQNPSGAWSYGYQTTLGGAFTLLTFPLTSFGDNPVPLNSWSKNGYEPVAVYHNGTTSTSISDGGAGVFPPGTTWFYPGVEGHTDNYGVIRFTVPTGGAGTYQLETTVRAYLDGPRSGDTDYHVLRNGVEVFGEFVSGNSGTGYSNRLSLAEGDRIDFAVGRGRDNIAFDSGLKIQASLALVSAPPPPGTNCVRMPTGLVGWWRAEGNANDETGAHHGALVGGVTYAPGVVGQGFYFDGLGSHVRIPHDSSLDFSNELTIELWYRYDGDENAYGLVSTRGTETGPVNYAISAIPIGIGPYFNDPTVNTGDDADQGGTFESSRHLPIPPTHVFHHLGVTYRQASPTQVELKTFVDGSLVRTKLLTAKLVNAMNDSAIVIGRSAEYGGEWFQGVIDEVAIYRRALTAVEMSGIAAARGAGKCSTNLPPPPSGTNCLSTPAGLVAWWPFNGNANDAVTGAALALSGGPDYAAGRVRQGLRFDGANDEAVAEASSALNVGTADGFSIETWVNPTHVTMQPLVEWSPGPNLAGVHFWLGVYGSGSIYANVVDVNGGQHSWRSDMDIVVPNAWQHVGLSYERSSGLLRFYLDGQKVTEHFLGSFTPQTTYQVLVGHRLNQERFSGVIDELSIYRRVLGDSEFAAIHASGAAGKCSTNAPPPPSNPPVILVQPQSQTVLAGGLATFSVTATGAPPLSYRWRRNGAAIPGATGPTLFLQNVGTTNQGLYSVVITNAFGFTVSSNAQLTVLGPTNSAPTITAQPTNQTVNGGGLAVFRVMAMGSAPLFHRWFFIGTNPVLRGSSSTLVLSNVNIGQAGGYFAVVSNAFGAVTSAVAQLTVLEPPPPATSVRLVAITNVWRYEQSGTDLGAAWREPNFDDSAWRAGQGLLGVETSSLLPEPILTPLTLGVVTYYFRTHFNLSGNPANALLVASNLIDDGAVFFLNGIEVGRIRVPEGQTAPTLAITSPVEGQYEVLNFPASVLRPGDNVLAVEVHQSSIASSDVVFGLSLHATIENPPPPPSPPVILSQPQSRTVFAGSSATFSVNATGAPPLAFIWRRNGQTIPAPNSPFLTFSNVTTASQGFYSVLVTNTHGSVLSSNATLTVLVPSNSPPTIFSITPSNRTVMAGTNVTISITATGAPPLAYRWVFNSEDLPGRTNRILSLTAVQPLNSGTYRCVVSNPFGSVTSAPSVLTVIDPFLPTNQPPNALATLEPSFDLSSEATNRFVICSDGIAARIVVDASFCSDPDGDSLQLFCVENDLMMPFPPNGRITNEFTLGSHTLAVLADDGRASATQTLNFEVLTAGEAVGELAALVETSSLPRRTKRGLLATLAASGTAYDRGDGTFGRRALDAFCAKVRSQVSAVSSAEADRLVNAGQRLLRAVGP